MPKQEPNRISDVLLQMLSEKTLSVSLDEEACSSSSACSCQAERGSEWGACWRRCAAREQASAIRDAVVCVVWFLTQVDWSGAGLEPVKHLLLRKRPFSIFDAMADFPAIV